jgi:hypothetical protein
VKQTTPQAVALYENAAKCIAAAVMTIDPDDYSTAEMARVLFESLMDGDTRSDTFQKRVKFASDVLQRVGYEMEQYDSAITDLIEDLRDTRRDEQAAIVINSAKLPRDAALVAVRDEATAHRRHREACGEQWPVHSKPSRIEDLVARRVGPLAGIDDAVPLAKLGPGGAYAHAIEAPEPSNGERNADATDAASG